MLFRSAGSLYGSIVIEEVDDFDQHGGSSTSHYRELGILGGRRNRELTKSSSAEYYDQPQYGGPNDLSRRHSGESEQFSLYRGSSSNDPRPLLALNPSLMSVATVAHPHPYHAHAPPSPSTYATSLHSRRSSESVRVLPTQPKATHVQDRAFSFSSSSERPDLRTDTGRPHSTSNTPTPASVNGAAVAPRRAPVVYPALLSRVAEAFKTRITVNERVKDGLVYSDTFDGRDAVDKIAYIIKTTDRNLALLLGRALDAQKFFHDVTYDHRLRDSPLELYQFKERLSGAFLSSEDLTPAAEGYAAVGGAAARSGSTTDTATSDESTFPSGVFTLLTDCYSPTCTRDRLCYSIACPRRLEQQARLNLKPKPGLQRSVSSESLGDLRVRVLLRGIQDLGRRADQLRQTAGTRIALDPLGASGRGRFDVRVGEEAPGGTQRGLLHRARLCARYGVPSRRASRPLDCFRARADLLSLYSPGSSPCERSTSFLKFAGKTLLPKSSGTSSRSTPSTSASPTCSTSARSKLTSLKRSETSS